MLDVLAHRGPDGEGSFVGYTRNDQQVFLGHRRLAIIDLSGAVQPMHDADLGLTLVFNGEIYNFRELRSELIKLGYQFKLDSDTEVLLRAYQHWDAGVVEHLRGMFAFVIWDARRERLFMARDRYGEKPLFVHENSSGVFFASEIKSLLCIPGCRRGVDLEAVSEYLAYRYVPGPRTLFAGISKLSPGSVALWQDGQLRQWRYWNSPDRIALPASRVAGRALAGGSEQVSQFLAHLEEAVRVQMISDVPFGAFLSGGLDSSMIVALMSRHCPRVRTFSVGFDSDTHSELPHASVVAKRFDTVHQEIMVSHHDLMNGLPKLIGFRDAPVSEPSDIAIHCMALAAARSVKMVLSGEGSDEILGGYPKHVFERYARRFQVFPHRFRERLIGPLVQALPYSFRRVKTAVANLNIDSRSERYVRWFGALSEDERNQLSSLPHGIQQNQGQPPFDSSEDNSALRRILYYDQTSWLPDNLLERGDRMTMAASIEARVPFLDHVLGGFVSSLPDHYRVRGMVTKWILRQAGKRLLPESILKRPKVGFRVPINQWFQKEMRGYLLDHLQGGDSLTRRYYRPDCLDRILREHLTGRQNHEKLLWSLLNLEIWHRQYAYA
jgi:asparagine synthase (glutamine-hydrolysing)